MERAEGGRESAVGRDMPMAMVWWGYRVDGCGDEGVGVGLGLEGESDWYSDAWITDQCKVSEVSVGFGSECLGVGALQILHPCRCAL